ncbi:hypothetical protein [Chryseobacterium sp. c4a]|uniref:hypothetical protein n=1 Tax=Chryseobacterium sp. c4a TaxID=1573582 RepID=UPI00135748CF|nr:hypothetical protein [Chryseobacterium sp. c4a]
MGFILQAFSYKLSAGNFHPPASGFHPILFNSLFWMNGSNVYPAIASIGHTIQALNQVIFVKNS